MLGIIILSAGRGTRMKSSLPKVMHPIAGKPMLYHVLRAVQSIQPYKIYAVSSEELKPHLKTMHSDGAFDVIIQEQPLGTGHAVRTALDHLDPNVTEVIILSGDTPLITTDTLKQIKDIQADIVVAGMPLAPEQLDKAYGRLRIENHQVMRIIEMKDASPEEKCIPFANAGVYKIKVDILKEILPRIENKNQAGEYYLTDVVHLAHEMGYQNRLVLGAEDDFMGVNSRHELSLAEGLMQDRLRLQHMNQGVTLIDPKTVYFQHDTVIESDVTIHPNVTFGSNVIVKSGVTIFQSCHIEKTTIGEYAKIGPFAHLRNHVELDEKTEIGNFVEIKNSTISKGSKIKHLSYIGDAEIGTKVNIGAGVITCNYNGFIKRKTTIGDGVFVGSNTALIAPITLHPHSIVGAGSTLSQDIESNDLVYNRAEVTIIKAGAITYKAKYKS
ncbi:MAG: bifunctional UDP-N-acetylglucosamine diphosphorylase/glucosamine-1-phosphate N-acetyltransferase GlmU [Alphaproteobacteria bacterium]|nr:bifunctional UDP-N-acetylglucosamine diphosphorylase/glucosamine-1-phosphate N-acetyltransferase GlmU [Alphaproteobacteria bacterium]